MLYERRFEERTLGLVCGAPTIYTPQPLLQSLFTKNDRLQLSDLTRPEFSHHQRWWKVVIQSREGKEILWQRPFASQQEAALVYLRLIGFDLERTCDAPIRVPGMWIDGELEYLFATVETFNSTPGGGTWTAPAGVTAVDYLIVAGGGGGGDTAGGGGGAGGMLTGSGSAVTPGSPYTVTIGNGGAKKTQGNTSTFNATSATGGGYGGTNDGADAGPVAGGAGGSGGGSANSASFANGGAGTGGQGSNGGANQNSNPYPSGGGGGASAAGAAGSGSQSGAGGNGSASSISGSSVTYAGGGGGGDSSQGAARGLGGSGGGGAGGTASAPTPGTDNLGGGGGGTGGNNGTKIGAVGGKGVVILSYTAAAAFVFRPNSFSHMLTR